MLPQWIKNRGFRPGALFLALLLAALTACSEAPEEQTPATPVAFESGDECHVCGMIIQEFPGPKGQAVEARSGAVRKFCSTRDMLSWWLEPENQNLRASLFVHDMARSDWQHPDDRHLIDARGAFYVVGSDLQGSMGPTLASFGNQQAAEQLARDQGGRVLRFEEITPATLAELIQLPQAPAETPPAPTPEHAH